MAHFVSSQILKKNGLDMMLDSTFQMAKINIFWTAHMSFFLLSESRISHFGAGINLRFFNLRKTMDKFGAMLSDVSTHWIL